MYPFIPQIRINLGDNKGSYFTLPNDEHAVLAKSKTNLNLREGKKTDPFRWTVKNSTGTIFSFGKQDGKGITPVVRIENQNGDFVQYSPAGFKGYVKPRVSENTAEWVIAGGVTAKYTMKFDSVKADYVINSKKEYDAIPGGDLTFDFQYGNVRDKESVLTPEIMPGGDIAILGVGGQGIFNIPIPEVLEKGKNKWNGSYKLSNQDKIKAEIAMILPESKLKNASWPITVDPVVLDSSVSTTGTAYANERKIIRDSYGNLIALADGGTGNDNVFYRANGASSSWTDAAIDIDGGAGSSVEISGDIDAAGNVHAAYRDTTLADIVYVKLTVTRDTSNAITGIAKSALLSLDTTGAQVTRPSLIIANKGEGSGKEKIVAAWQSNTSGASARGEVRLAQCDVADTCTTASNWKNASEEVNFGGACSDQVSGVPSSTTCAGGADVILKDTTSHTTHQVVLTQIPGKARRLVTSVKRYVSGAFSANLNNTEDGNSGTNDGVGSLPAADAIYIGDANKFSKVIFDLTANGNSNPATSMITSYCSANSDITTACDTWTTVSNQVDYSQGTSNGLAEDGSLLFDEPVGWIRSTEDSEAGYWVRTSPSGTFDLSVEIADIYLGDRNSKSLMIAVGIDRVNDLRVAYVPWDEVSQAAWEDNPASANNPWRADAGTTSSAIADTGYEVTTFTNHVISATVDYENNQVFVGYMAGTSVGSSNLTVKRAPNNKSLTVAANWEDAAFPATTEAADSVISLTSDGNDIYMFYVLDPDATGLVYRKCTATLSEDGSVCSGGWGSESTLVAFASTTQEPSHPQPVVSKAQGDNIAIDTIYTNLIGTPSVEHERHYVGLADKSVSVAASGDDASNWECGTDGTSVQGNNDTTLSLGRNNIMCAAGTLEAPVHTGIRFPGVAVAQGAAVSSAYIDFRVISRDGSSNVDFSIYGEDADNSSQFSNLAVPPGCDSTCIYNRTRTTSSESYSINFTTNTYRVDVTKIVQEIVCRGAVDSQPCVGNYNGSGSWSSGNALTVLLISSEATDGNYIGIVAQDSTTGNLEPTLHINCSASCNTPLSGKSEKIDDAGDPGFAVPKNPIVRTSSGEKYTFIYDSAFCEVWKSTDGSNWNEVDAADKPGCSATYSIAIDSNDTLHMVYADDVVGGRINYISMSGDQFGSEEVVELNGAGNLPGGISLAVDSNDIPHVVTTVAEIGNSTYVEYDNRVGGSWNNQVTVESILVTNNFKPASLTIDEDNLPEIAYTNTNDSDLTVAVGNQNDASSFTLHDVDASVNITDDHTASIAIDSAGNTWVAYVDATGTNQITLATRTDGNETTQWSTGWTASITNSNVGNSPSIAINGTDVYIIYEDSADDDIKFDRYSNGAWVGEQTLDVGTFVNPRAKWSFFNNNEGSSQIDYLYTDGTDIYYNRLLLSGLSNSWCSIDGTAATSNGANDCNSGWTTRKKITFNNEAASEALVNFPVLLRLTSSNIDYSRTKSSGEDLRFVDSTGGILDYEIQEWDENGESLVWVRVPQIDAYSNDDYIWMYYDNSSGDAGADASNTWDSNYRGVWHMEGTNGSATLSDSTSPTNNATKSSGTGDGQPTNYTPAVIEDGQDFDGTDDNASIADDSVFDVSASGTYSWSLWINPDDFEEWNATWWQGISNTNQFAITAHTSTDGVWGPVTAGISAGTQTAGAVTSIVHTKNNVLTVGKWTHVGVTYDGSQTGVARWKIYINGVDQVDTSDATGIQGTTGDVTPSAVYMGYENVAGENFDGKEDEVRYHGTLRSQSWMEAEYFTSSPNVHYAVFGAEEGTTTATESIKKYSSGVTDPYIGSYADLGHPFSSSEYLAVSSYDSSTAQISASSVPSASTSAVPMFMFKVNNPNDSNAYKIDAVASVSSSIATSASRKVQLQVYRGGSTNKWITLAENSGTAAGTGIILDPAQITSNFSDYFFAESGPGTSCDASSTNCWTYWRVWQDAATEGNQVLSADYFNVTFENGGPTQVGFSNAARTLQVRACNGAAKVFTMELQNGAGDPTNPQATTVVRVTSNAGSYVIYSDNTCSTPVSNGDFTFTTSENSKSVYIVDSSAAGTGTRTLTGTRQSGDILTTGTQDYSIFGIKSKFQGGTRIRGGTRIQ